MELGGDLLRTEADEGGLLRAAKAFWSAASFATEAVVGENAELRMLGGLVGSRAGLVSNFLAAGAFAFSVAGAGAVAGWRGGLGAAGAVAAADADVDVVVRVLADEEPVPCAAVGSLARDPELEDDAALRTGLFGRAGEGRGEVVADFDGGRVRFFPDLVAGATLFVLLEENADFVGDLGAGPALAAAGFGFGSALTGFVGSSAFFPVGIESSCFCEIVSPCLVEVVSKPGDSPVPMEGKGTAAVYPFRVSRSCFLRFASSSGCLLANSATFFSLAVSKGPPNIFAPSETETTGLIGPDADGAFCSPRAGLLFPRTATNDVPTLPSGLGPGL